MLVNGGFTTHLHEHTYTRAGDRTRTGDVQLGKLAFYQLNYARDAATNRNKRNMCGDSASLT